MCALLLGLPAVGSPPARPAGPARAWVEPTLRSAAQAGYAAASADPLERLGLLEERLVRAALTRHGLRPTRFADGRTVDRILVETFDVFLEDDLFPDVLNWLHTTTRADVIRQLLTLQTGDLYHEDRAQESRRLLLGLSVLTTAVLVPVEAERPGHIDLLVVTKDLWSLRLNSNFQLTGQHLDWLSASASENNFMGRGKQLSLSFLLEPDIFSLGPTYVDKQLFGSRLTFSEAVKAAFSRSTGRFEGAFGALQLGRPLYSLESRWGWTVDAAFRHLVLRQFSGGQQLRYPFDAAPDDETIPWALHDRYLDLSGAVTRSLGSDVKHDVSWGWRLRVRDPYVPEAQRYSPELVEAFTADLLPARRRDSTPFMAYRTWEPTFRTYENLETLGLAEHLQMGHDVSTAVGLGHPMTGSLATFVTLSADGAYRTRLAGDDLLGVAAAASGRLSRGRFADATLGGGLRYASPTLGIVRLHVSSNLSVQLEDSDNALSTLGGNNGLRGYPSSHFLGSNLVRVNVEVRSLGAELWSTWLGGVVFYDGGDVFNSDDLSDVGWHSGVGLGLRWLLPQFNRVVFRLDWGFPVDAPAPLPGSLGLGFEQAF